MELKEYSQQFVSCVMAVETDLFVDVVVRGENEKSVLEMFAYLIKAYAEQSGRHCQDVINDIEMTMIEVDK